jgi:exonuclease sbcCD, D subunit
MRVLHTADWHLGQTFYQYDRYEEHQHFLNWLLQTIEQERIDVLLISGDIFDVSNPAVASVRQFYHFLREILQRFPELQVIATAGNHDSPVRLEMPVPFLEGSHIHLIGSVKRSGEGAAIDYRSLIIPLYKPQTTTVEAYCLSVPFLRLGDYPKAEGNGMDYAKGVSQFYQEITKEAQEMLKPHQALIAMGHLHASGAEISEEDTAERAIVGGVEAISAGQFPEALQYVALGHIHKAQRLAGKDFIRYSGSPLPLSFAERRYSHQVVCFEIEDGKVSDIRTLNVPLHRRVLSIPETHRPIEEVLAALGDLPERGQQENTAPYLEVKVLLTEPLPDLKTQIIKAVEGKAVRLSRIDVQYKWAIDSEEGEPQREIQLEELSPQQVLKGVYEKTYNEEMPTFYEALVEEVLQELEAQQNNA